MLTLVENNMTNKPMTLKITLKKKKKKTTILHSDSHKST